MVRGDRTQAEMAEALGMPLRTYQRLEGAERFPQEATLEQITAKLGVSEESLFRIPKSKESPLLAEIIAILPALDQPQLESLLGTAKLFREVNTLLRSKESDLAHKNR